LSRADATIAAGVAQAGFSWRRGLGGNGAVQEKSSLMKIAYLLN
jgi:hypothetical protein